MDSIDLHLNIQNSLNETLKQTQSVMHNLNDSILDAAKGLNKSSSFAEKISDSYDDIEPQSKRISLNTKVWGNTLGKVKDLFQRLALGFTTIFSIATIADTTVEIVKLNQTMIDLSYRMGDAGKTAGALEKAVFNVAQQTGLATEESTELIKELRKYRISVTDINQLGTSMGHFSKITGVAVNDAARLGGELSRTGRLGAESIEDMLTVMASVQRSVGLTEEEMARLSDSTIYSTRMLNQMGKSSEFIESFNKGAIQLAGAFAKVGVEADKANQFIEDLLDPGKIEDNALLYAKLGISIEDAITGNVDPSQLAKGFKNLGSEIKGMSGPAGAALAQALGMPLQDLRAMADMSEDEIQKFGNLAGMSEEQKGAQRNFEETINNIKTALAEIGNKFMPVITKISELFANNWERIYGAVSNFTEKLGKKLVPIVNKLIDFFTSGKFGEWLAKIVEAVKKFASPTLWLGALAILFIVIKKVRSKFFSMVTDVGEKLGISARKGLSSAADEYRENMQAATEEAFEMASRKSSMVGEMKPKQRGRRLSLEARIVEGEDYQKIQGLADVFDTIADSNLFPAVKRMTENTADWLRKISMGSKPMSYLNMITEKRNKMIEDRLNFAKEENVILTETFTRQQKSNESLIKDYEERRSILDEINKTQGMTADQAWEYHQLGKNIINLEKERETIASRISKEADRFRKVEEKAYRQVGNMSEQQKKALFDRIDAESQAANASLARSRERIDGLKLEEQIISRQQETLREAMENIDQTTSEGVMSYNKMNDELKKINNMLIENKQNQSFSTAEMQEQNDTASELQERLSRIAKISGTTAEEMRKMDVPLKERPFRRMMNFMGSAFRAAGSRIETTFDKARNSIVAIKDNIAEKLKPKNWLKSIKEGVRGFSDRDNSQLRKSMSSLGGTFKKVGGIIGKLGLPLLLLGIATEALKPIMDDLKPVLDIVKDVIVDLINTLAKTILPPILRFAAKILPVLGMLVDKLLPPLLQVLGVLLKILGKVLEVIGNLISTMAELPIKLGVKLNTMADKIGSFFGKDKGIVKEAKDFLKLSARDQNISQEELMKILIDKAGGNVAAAESNFGRALQDLAQGRFKINEDQAIKLLEGREIERRKSESSAYQFVNEIGNFTNEFGQMFQDLGQDVFEVGKSMSGQTTFYDALTKVAAGIENVADNLDSGELYRAPEAGEGESTGGAGATTQGSAAIIGVTGSDEKAQFYQEKAAQEEQIDYQRRAAESSEESAEGTSTLVQQTEKQNELMTALIGKIDDLVTTMRGGSRPIRVPAQE
jgi:phage-related protein